MPQGKVSHRVLLEELSRLHEGLALKMGMPNGALMPNLRPVNKLLMCVIDSLRGEKRSECIAHSFPEGLLKTKGSRKKKVERSEDISTPRPRIPIANLEYLPTRHNFLKNLTTAPLIAAIAATNNPSGGKPLRWKMVGNRKDQNKLAQNDTFPPSLNESGGWAYPKVYLDKNKCSTQKFMLLT